MTRPTLIIAAVLSSAACLIAGIAIGRHTAYRAGIDDGARRALTFVARVQGTFGRSQERVPATWYEPYDPEGLFV